MSTNEPHPDNDSGPPWDDPATDCPSDRLASALVGCRQLRERAVTETTTVRARDVAGVAKLTSRQASYALRALAATDPAALADRGLEPTVAVGLEEATHRYQRFTVREVDS